MLNSKDSHTGWAQIKTPSVCLCSCTCALPQGLEHTTPAQYLPSFFDSVTRYLSTHTAISEYMNLNRQLRKVWFDSLRGNKREHSKLFVLLGIIGRGFIPPILIQKSLRAKWRGQGSTKTWVCSSAEAKYNITSKEWVLANLQLLPFNLQFFNKDCYTGKTAITFYGFAL